MKKRPDWFGAIVPKLRVGMHPVTLCVTSAQDLRLVSLAGRGASQAALPRRAWERSRRGKPLPWI